MSSRAKASLLSLFRQMEKRHASDLHLSVGAPPEMRVHGELVLLGDRVLTAEHTRELCLSVLTDEQRARFDKNLELDFALQVNEESRYRGNLFFQKGAVSGVFRRLPMKIPELDSLGLPKTLRKVLGMHDGLILVCGATGSGKSTTLAAMIDAINSAESGHIVTVEDPIEYVHKHKKCVVSQRELGSDTKSFSMALRQVLRQDPDYILVGELRDLETIELALVAAETGHLVFGTLHTQGVVQSILRFVNVFPPHQQSQVRNSLAYSIKAILSQQLVPKKTDGRALASELLIPNYAIRSLIRDDKVHQIYSSMQTGQSSSGMYTMNQSLLDLWRQRVISTDTALRHSLVPDELTDMMKGYT